jgi:hypothetical protein
MLLIAGYSIAGLSYEVRTPFNGVTLIPSFETICELVQKLKGKDTDIMVIT